MRMPWLRQHTLLTCIMALGAFNWDESTTDERVEPTPPQDRLHTVSVPDQLGQSIPAAYQSTQETTTALVDDCRTTPLLEGHSELFLRSLGLKVFQCRRTHAMNESPVSPACPAGPKCNQPTTWDILIVPPHRVSQYTLRNLETSTPVKTQLRWSLDSPVDEIDVTFNAHHTAKYDLT